LPAVGYIPIRNGTVQGKILEMQCSFSSQLGRTATALVVILRRPRPLGPWSAQLDSAHAAHQRLAELQGRDYYWKAKDGWKAYEGYPFP
jgi:hypothetical protein